MKPPTDEQLLADFLAGQPNRFDELVHRHADELFRFLARITRDAAQADDLTQEVFLQVYRSADRFDPDRRFRPWLYTIAANKARDLLRSRRRRPQMALDAQVDTGQEGQSFADFLADNAASPVENLEAGEQRARVRQVVAEMPDHLREVLVLNYFHHFAYKEIAEMLELPLGTVKNRLHAAVGFFGKAYKAAAKDDNTDD